MSNFGEVFFSVDCIGWVNDISWSPSGSFLAGVSHDSKVHFVSVKNSQDFTYRNLQWKSKAFYRVCFINDNSLICCGYDRAPILYIQKNGEFEEKAIMDECIPKPKPVSYLDERKNIFEKSKLGESREEIEFLQILPTKHKNSIMYQLLNIYLFRGAYLYDKGVAVTMDLSGFIFFWKIN